MKVAAAYIRVSTDMQTEYSPDSQLRLIREYAQNNQMVIPDEFIYMEQGVSGKRADKRPEFQKMMTAAKSKQFEAILIYHTSRFARNHEESIVYKSMLKRDCEIDVISITQPPIDRKTDMLTNAIYSVMDEWYSIDLAANVKRGMTEKAMRGGYQCSPPYGYKIPGHKRPPEIVEDEAKVVKIVFDMYLNGMTSLWNIGKRINDMGYRTRRGKAFERRAVEYILTNPIYKGVAVWNKRNNNKSFNDPSEWIVAKGTHEAIISPDIFDKAQDVYQRNKKTKNGRPPGTYKHWLTGLFKCSECGRGLTYAGGRYAAFSCNGYKKGICNTCNSIRQPRAEEYVMAVIEKVSESIYDVPLEKIVCKNETSDAAISLLKERLVRMDKKLRRYKDAFSAGYDTLEEYGENKKTILAEKSEIFDEIAKLTVKKADISSPSAIRETAKTIYRKLGENALSVEEKSQLVRTLINKIIFDRNTNTYNVFFNL